MRNLFNRLLNALNINGRDWGILILSLLLAFSVWLIHNLSLKYNANLKAKVVAICSLDGHENVSAAWVETAARGRATGYNIIASYLRSGRPVKVEFNPSVMQHYDKDRFFVTADRLNEYSHLIFGEDFTIEHYISDTLFFRFPSVHHKKVPVTPVTLLTYKGQYMGKEPLKVMPDSVVVEGDPYLLESVKQVYTSPIRHFDISESISGVVAVEPIKGVGIQSSEVYYSQDVARYVEFVSESPVSARNVPADKAMMIFPSFVRLRLRCEFPLLDDAVENVSLYVDYDDFKSSIKGNCPVRLSNMPRGVLSYEVEPASVRCVEETR